MYRGSSAQKALTRFSSLAVGQGKEGGDSGEIEKLLYLSNTQGKTASLVRARKG